MYLWLALGFNIKPDNTDDQFVKEREISKGESVYRSKHHRDYYEAVRQDKPLSNLQLPYVFRTFKAWLVDMADVNPLPPANQDPLAFEVS